MANKQNEKLLNEMSNFFKQPVFIAIPITCIRFKFFRICSTTDPLRITVKDFASRPNEKKFFEKSLDGLNRLVIMVPVDAKARCRCNNKKTDAKRKIQNESASL